MRALSILVILIGLAVGLLVVIPLVGLAMALLIPLAFLFIWLLPILIIAGSDRTTGIEKLMWILAIVFLSWFAWILYFLLAPVGPDRHESAFRPYHY
jgi:membrane protease YdiL (CAAX protease family)